MEIPLRLYVPEPLEQVSIAQPFWFRFPGRAGTLFLTREVPESFFAKNVKFVSIDEAEAIVLPNNFSTTSPRIEAYIRTHADEAETRRIPIFVFSGGDFTDHLEFDPRVYIFRQSVYRQTLAPRVIVTPTLAEDYGKKGIQIRSKAHTPTVSFCGQAGYNQVSQWLRYYLKTGLKRIQALLYPQIRARLLGVYWRRTLVRACEESALVRTHFILRNSFSGAKRTIELDPEQARLEFIQSIVESDFVLAPKGDGNYSNRFLEALALGRIPVLLDTDTVLPFENEIAYERVMVRVPMNEVNRTPQLISAWYAALSDEEWRVRQNEARALFETRLRFDVFFEHFFTRYFKALPADARNCVSIKKLPL